MCKESDTSLVKPDKMNQNYEPKRGKLAKQKHGVNIMHTNISVTFDMTHNTHTALLYSTF